MFEVGGTLVRFSATGKLATWAGKNLLLEASGQASLATGASDVGLFKRSKDTLVGIFRMIGLDGGWWIRVEIVRSRWLAYLSRSFHLFRGRCTVHASNPTAED